jgi:GTP-binding protein LepA
MDHTGIRNFCIIAHIDHGKSTLADRLLEVTGTVNAGELLEQHLDSMDLERERGITIKAQAVRMAYSSPDGTAYQLNLIDTPGHVDFSYEVSRSLAACEGAILLVDATQGIQAQTLANVYLAMEKDLAVVPVINKIDSDAAETDRVIQELEQTFGFSRKEIFLISAKTGEGVQGLVEKLPDLIPAPIVNTNSPLRALIFDSTYNQYKGVIAYVRLVDGYIVPGQTIKFLSNGVLTDVMEVGSFNPKLLRMDTLQAGEVGYIATGLKSVNDCRVGDTITSLTSSKVVEPLIGYKPLKPLVFAGLYPTETNNYQDLREALERFQLNDAALTFTPEVSPALGAGFRCGFLGLLHMEIVQERLEREYGIDMIITAPSVSYLVKLNEGKEIYVGNPGDMPSPDKYREILEPWLSVKIVTPARFLGPLMELIKQRRGEFSSTEYLDHGNVETAGNGKSGPSLDPRVLLTFNLPLSELLTEMYSKVKGVSQGYATLDYEFTGYRVGLLTKLDLLVNGQIVDALSLIVHRDKGYLRGKGLVQRLKKAIPRQLFEVAIQASMGNRIIARETIPALRKDVLAKLYGGDVTRKMKLLAKQAEGKKRMKRLGKLEIPQEAFLSVLRSDGN